MLLENFHAKVGCTFLTLSCAQSCHLIDRICTIATFGGESGHYSSSILFRNLQRFFCGQLSFAPGVEPRDYRELFGSRSAIIILIMV